MEQLESIREMHHIRNGMLQITVPESFNNKNVEVIVLSLPESSDLEPGAE